MAKELSTQSRWKPWKGIVLFLIAFVWLFIGSIGTILFGTVGVIFLQLGFLGMAIAACKINKTPLKEVFPLHKITVRDFFGTFLMWVGALPIGLVSVLAMGKIFPESMEQVAESITQIATGTVILGFIATVICPPICEEAIMRGAVLSNFRSLKKDWAIILIIGLLFGVLHTDPIRFINTSILGACMAYLMLKRNNFFLPMLFHFINNFVTIGISLLASLFETPSVAEEGTTVATEVAVSGAIDALPSMMIIACACPTILTIGAHLIKRQMEISENKEAAGMKLGAKIALSLIPDALLLIGGIMLSR